MDASRPPLVPVRLARTVGAALALAAGAPEARASEAPFVQPRDGEGRFVNLDGSGAKGFGAVLKWGILDRFAGKRPDHPDRAEVPRVVPDLALLRRPPGPGEGARVTWIGHSTFLVQLDGVTLLTDPTFGPIANGFISRNGAPGVRYEDLPFVDAALVSHDHYDHLDLPTLKWLNVPIVAGLGSEALFRKSGLRATEVGWWEQVRLGPVTVTFVPAQHWARRGFGDTNTRLWGGFVIQGSSATLYHAGDSGWFEAFHEIGRRFPGIDLAMLPAGAYDPRWFMSAAHMDPEESLRAVLALGARTYVPMHWGTYKLADEPLDEPPRRIEAERARLGLPADRVRVLALGETLRVEPVAAAVAGLRP
jgi:L-ascorbate metabolism protein UlaG (beta-lactamase superfamily)